MADELILLGFWASPFGMRVRIALAEKGIENYKYKEEELSNKTQFLLKMNPVRHQVPVLIHNGKPVCESTIILEYIDEVWKDKSPLLPSDPYQRARVRFWADYVDKKVYSSARLVLMSKGEVQEAAKKDVIEIFKVLEGELGEKAYFGGESLGMVDVGLIPFTTWFYTLEKCAKLSMVAECPKLVGWAKRCLEKRSVSKTLPDPDKTHDYIMELIRKYGAK